MLNPVIAIYVIQCLPLTPRYHASQIYPTAVYKQYDYNFWKYPKKPQHYELHVEISTLTTPFLKLCNKTVNNVT